MMVNMREKGSFASHFEFTLLRIDRNILDDLNIESEHIKNV